MSRIFVTGGSGRLGRSVVSGLAEAGHQIISVDRDALPAGTFPAGVEQETADLLAPGEARRLLEKTSPDAVIHLAAIAVPFSAPEDVILSTNTRLAYAVISAATELGIGRIITASSPTVLGYGSPAGWLPEYFPLDEETTPRPWNAYALSKLIAEQTVQMFAAAQGDRIRYAAFRPCYVISPEEWTGAPTQQGHTVRERLADPALSAPALFNYVDARDVADFLDLLLRKMDSIPNGQTFFVGAPDALAMEPLAQLMPRFLPGSSDLAAGLTGSSPAFSIAKAKELLGWEPKRTWRTELTPSAGAVVGTAELISVGTIPAGTGSKETKMKFDGVLFFPVTPFDADGAVDVDVLKEHITSRLPYGPGGVFPACGTGEFHALSIDEVRTVVTAAVEAVAGKVPVVAGAGGPLGHALAAARAAEEAGADALLVLPPYLVTGPTEGLVAYIEAVANASSLPVIVYHRGTAKFTARAISHLARNPKVIGFKDGIGDVGLAQEIVSAVKASGRTDFLLFNGLLTAELTQGAYRGLGIPLYSSAAFAMAPEIAKAYYDAYMNGDEDRRQALLEGFYAPLVRLRDQTPGFGVSLIKAGLRLAGLPVGSVRPPLVDPTEDQLLELKAILAKGHELAGS